MKLFDCHFHITDGEQHYGIQPDARNVIFNYISEYEQKKEELKQSDCISLIFEFRNALDFVEKEVNTGRVVALKIHSRIQQLEETDYPLIFDCYEERFARKQIPVIFDAFYFGADFRYQPNLQRMAEFARRFKETKVIIAHSGGFRALEYFLHLKELPNIHFDLSFSLAYLSYASVYQDFKNLLRFASPEKLLFGTDFPFVSAKVQLERILEIFSELNMPEEKQQKILFQNSYDLFFRK
jgi:predicted TIM-barrel fold metal-dependent hydrolase